MTVRESISEKPFLWLIPGFMLLLALTFSCGEGKVKKGKDTPSDGIPGSNSENVISGKTEPVYALLVVPGVPRPGEPFRVVVTGGKNIHKAKIMITGPSGSPKSKKSRAGEGLPHWRMVEFPGCREGTYLADLIVNKKVVSSREFRISEEGKGISSGKAWNILHGWDNGMEALYSAWVHALFQGCDEREDWAALHEVTQNRERNFLYNYLSLDEDNPEGKIRVVMQPDCADNPFFLRAYFAWKLGLPFGYHVCDRGWVGNPPKTGQWITCPTASKNHPVLVFNNFLRRMKDGVHSGTARTAFENQNSDYYPVALEKESVRPGTVFADPYGHTLIIISWVPQTRNRPGRLLAVDAQPDGTVAIKRFWKGNFLFNTSEVVGEPGFKAFRPTILKNGALLQVRNEELTVRSGYVPFSLHQKNMESPDFYRNMERLINPRPLKPRVALLDLIKALHEQLITRVTSVANGEKYFQKHPGMVIPMPGSAPGIFQTGGVWEDFSTPNRDLRLLIAMDEVIGLPDRVAGSPEDFSVSLLTSPERVGKRLHSLLEKKTSKLSITYNRTDGSSHTLTIAEIIRRKEAFEMAYNPNDGPEIRWGAQEGSEERSTCRRYAPPGQLKTMESVREWFKKRLHPPT